MPGPGIEPRKLHLSAKYSEKCNVPSSIPGPGTRKIFIKKVVEDGWALQVNGA